MRPGYVKTAGYLVSTGSVALLGVAAWPGAVEAGLASFLVLGMVASVAGMACRWWSYALEHHQESRRCETAAGEPPRS